MNVCDKKPLKKIQEVYRMLHLQKTGVTSEKGQESFKHRLTDRSTRHVKKAQRGYETIDNGNHCAIPRVSAIETMSKEEKAR